ncbi:hypothetical protein KW850_15675 [Bacillus sp. sid0103]|uniref:hypothetical protein n=1 Tax=Bacillus sp. sid0103 TaxID=2856337 RepID=UPI001C463AB9|nr:hypothetical protein [Bacillus sp. sid0103]MBV7506704.1 hypothetical protein [Bacillus sp. sid0103]
MIDLKNILMSDSKVFEMSFQPSQEPFVDLVNFDSEIIVDPTLSSRTPYFSFVRLSIAEKLIEAKKYLPEVIRFFLKEGFRPVSIQEQAFKKSV